MAFPFMLDVAAASLEKGCSLKSYYANYAHFSLPNVVPQLKSSTFASCCLSRLFPKSLGKKLPTSFPLPQYTKGNPDCFLHVSQRPLMEKGGWIDHHKIVVVKYQSMQYIEYSQQYSRAINLSGCPTLSRNNILLLLIHLNGTSVKLSSLYSVSAAIFQRLVVVCLDS